MKNVNMIINNNNFIIFIILINCIPSNDTLYRILID